MKKILIAIIILSFSLSPIRAEDYSTSHSFSAGDVISAEMVNEIFDDIENVTKVITESDFIGSWDIVQTTCKDGGPGNCSSLTMTGMSNDANGITRSRSDTVTFTDDGDDTFSFSQTTYASLVRSGAGNTAGSGGFAVVNGFGLFNDTTHGMGMFNVKEISPTRIVMTLLMSGSASYNIIRLDKQATPPSNPTALAATTTNLSNVLTWTDNSSDETGFKVYKKTSATGSWSLLDAGAGLTVISDVTTYTDTVTEAGDYWYRVKANNITNGDSVGSNVIKTTNTD